MYNISSNQFFSQSAQHYWHFWITAIIYNVVTWFVIFAGGYNRLSLFNESPFFYFFALLPFIGVLLIGYAIQKTLIWYKYGKAFVILDPSPGQVGGNCSGYLKLPFSTADISLADICLSCSHRSIERINNGRPRQKTEILWQEKMTLKPVKEGQTMRLDFCFVTPPHLPETARKNRTNYLWQLYIHIPLSGMDYKSVFELPMKKIN